MIAFRMFAWRRRNDGGNESSDRSRFASIERSTHYDSANEKRNGNRAINRYNRQFAGEVNFTAVDTFT